MAGAGDSFDLATLSRGIETVKAKNVEYDSLDEIMDEAIKAWVILPGTANSIRMIFITHNVQRMGTATCGQQVAYFPGAASKAQLSSGTIKTFKLRSLFNSAPHFHNIWNCEGGKRKTREKAEPHLLYSCSDDNHYIPAGQC